MSTAVHPQVTQGVLDLAMDILHEELGKMEAICLSLVDRLRPENLDDIRDDEDIVSYRLAQVLEDRLSSTKFENSLRQSLHVKTSTEA